MNPQKKVIFCDIDGTLLTNDGILLDGTIQKIQQTCANDDNFIFNLISGRSWRNEYLIFQKLKIAPKGYLISSNGALIYSLSKNKIIKDWEINEIISQLIYDKVMELAQQNPNLGFNVNYSDDPGQYAYKIKHLKTYTANGQIDCKPRFSNQHVLLFMVFGLGNQLPTFVNWLKQFNLNVLPGPNLTFINAIGASKKEAVEYILDHDQLNPNQCAVFGNSKNDLSMFQIPNIYSVTYKTAKPYLIKIAKDVVDDEPSAFVCQGIDDFLNYLTNQE